MNRRGSGLTARLGVVVLAGALSLASCVFTDYEDLSTSIVVRFDEDGLTAVISLERPVRLPLDEDDALYIMNQCSCACRGNLTRVHDYWQYPEYPDSSG